MGCRRWKTDPVDRRADTLTKPNEAALRLRKYVVVVMRDAGMMEEDDPNQSSFLPPFANEENKEIDRYIKVSLVARHCGPVGQILKDFVNRRV